MPSIVLSIREFRLGNRSSFVACICFCLTVLLGAPAIGSAKETTGVSFILFVADDLRWDALAASGNTTILTPQLDLLAQSGILFENAFVTTSICASSRASIFTGQYVRRHGIWDFQTELSPAQLSSSYLGVLKSAGYQLGFVGKWGVGNPPAKLFDFDKSFAGQGQYFVEKEGQKVHLTSIMAQDAIDFLEQVDPARPFCLSISFKAPHVQDSYHLADDPFPYDPDFSHLYKETRILPPPTAESIFFERLPDFLKNSEGRLRWAIRFWGPQRYQDSVRGYYRLISGLDRAIGQIWKKLRTTRFAGNTVILFTSDNGFYLGERGLAGKWFAHEESIRVPFVVVDPRLQKLAGERRQQMILNLDIAPTILDIAGLPIPAEMQGESMSRVFEGKDSPWREEFFYEHLFQHPRIPPSEAIRTKSWKYIRYIETDPPFEELYDLRADPLERHNLASIPEYDEVLLHLRNRWHQWREKIK